MAEVQIVRTQQVPSAAPGRAGQLDYWVTYTPAPGIFRTVIIPEATPEVAKVQAAIRANEQHASSINGTRFTI